MAIYDAQDGEQPGEIEAHFNLARALVAAGGDRERAISEAEKTRDAHRNAGAGKSAALAEVEAWLAAQRRR